jgi:hypothetical protein
MSVVVLAIGALTVLGLVAAGCGGSKAPAVAALGGETTTSASGAPSGRRRGGSDSDSNPAGGPAAVFFACLRTHGVPNMPVPGPGNWVAAAGVDPSSPRFQQAERVCALLAPADAPPSMVSHPVGPLPAFARCMRKHGVSTFPDPDARGTCTRGRWPESTRIRRPSRPRS